MLPHRSRWGGRDFEEILTYKIPVTVGLDAAFAVEAEPPFLPVGFVQPDGIDLTVRSMFKLASKVKRTSDLAHGWDELALARTVTTLARRLRFVDELDAQIAECEAELSTCGYPTSASSGSRTSP